MRRRVVVIAAVLVGMSIGGTAEAARKVPDCLRGGARIVTDGALRADSDRPIRSRTVVVRRRLSPGYNESYRANLLACWRPTGRRTVIRRESQSGLDGGEENRVTVVSDRFVGVHTFFYCGICGTWGGAEVWDARRGRRLHRSAGCQPTRGDTISGGAEEVVFLRGGGMAYLCDQLRIADRRGDRQLAPPGSRPRELAVTPDPHVGLGSARERLYWVTGAFGSEQAHSLVLD
jgi:hypothetical protein